MKWGETTRCETTWGEYVSWRNYNATQRRFLTWSFFASVTFLHSSSFYIRVRSFCSGYRSFCHRVFLFCIQLFISEIRDWDCWFYKDHRSFFNFYMFYEYNRLFCRSVFFTLSAAHKIDAFMVFSAYLGNQKDIQNNYGYNKFGCRWAINNSGKTKKSGWSINNSVQQIWLVNQ